MLDIYEINSNYIDFLNSHEKHLFQNATAHQKFTRKYIGIVLEINGYKYFAPLSSFKEKHKRLTETLDFIKIGTVSVLNLNNMFPVPEGLYAKVIIKNEKDNFYKNLLKREYKIIRQKSNQILQNAKSLYEHKLRNGSNSKLGKRCNDFIMLEEVCKSYQENN